MVIRLTIDPGIRGAGVALFSAELIAAAYVKNPLAKGNQAAECAAVGRAVERWVRTYMSLTDVEELGVEWPRILKGGRQKGDSDDLPALAGVSTAVAVYFSEANIKSFYPRDWKSTIEPDVMTNRIFARLSDKEKSRVSWFGRAKKPTQGMMHNVFDAVGIGLHMLGRLERQRAYAGVDES